ncbi:MAG: MFS transporter [Catenulispora sp.]|nr:MFS transporter [Catenulispora sp.]
MFYSRGDHHTGLGPDFRRIWISVTISSLGDGMRFVALPLLAARLSSDPRQIAAVYLAEQLPLPLFGLLAGAFADRADRRRILWLADALRAGAVGALAAAVAAHALTIHLLIGVGFVLGLGQTFYNGAWSGMVPTLVAPKNLTRANARLQAGALVSDTLLGTPLGALLFGIAAALPFTVDAASFAAAAALAFLLRGDFGPTAATAPATWLTLRHDMAHGVRWLWRHHLLRRLCLIAGVTNLVTAALIAVLVLYARHTLHVGSLGFALLIASFAVGGMAGAAATPGLTSRFGSRPVLTVTAAATALASAAAGAATSGPAAGAAIAAFGAANLAWSITAVSLRQRLVPAELLGRVAMAYQMVIGGATAAGAAAGGFVAGAFGLRAPFYAGAVVLVAASFISTRGEEVGSRASQRQEQVKGL